MSTAAAHLAEGAAENAYILGQNARERQAWELVSLHQPFLRKQWEALHNAGIWLDSPHRNKWDEGKKKWRKIPGPKKYEPGCLDSLTLDNFLGVSLEDFSDEANPGHQWSAREHVRHRVGSLFADAVGRLLQKHCKHWPITAPEAIKRGDAGLKDMVRKVKFARRILITIYIKVLPEQLADIKSRIKELD